MQWATRRIARPACHRFSDMDRASEQGNIGAKATPNQKRLLMHLDEPQGEARVAQQLREPADCRPSPQHLASPRSGYG